MGLACQLLNRHQSRYEHHAGPSYFGEKRRSTGRASGSCPSGGPSVAPLLCQSRLRAGHPVRSLSMMGGTVHEVAMVVVVSPTEEGIMQTTTATSTGPVTPLRREGDMANSSLTNAGPRMVRLTVNLPSHLVEQMRDAVYWTPGLTLAWMIARAVRTSLTELETVHQGPFPRRLKPLRAGRPRRVGQFMHLRPIDGTGAADVPNAAAPVVAKAEVTTPLKSR
jgi:hypothetical protein